MLTRGYFIGEIVDALSDVAGQVSTRGRLGLTDLNKHAEDFFKTILNHLFSYSLTNLNEDRSNAPGLDLADKSNGIAFQITAERTSAKVNDTIAKLTDKQIAAYPRIRILMIAGRQTSYTLDPTHCARVGFNKDDIWDIDVLCKRCMDLQIDILQSLYNYVRAELARVKIELEIPDVEGKYPTNLADYIENIPKPTMSDFTKFNKFLEDSGVGEPIETTVASFTEFSKNLAKLPRITREFLSVMIERREVEARRGGFWNEHVEINHDKLDRISRYPDHAGELRILGSYNFVYIMEPDHEGESGFWRISFPGTPTEYELRFIEFVEANLIPISRPLVSLDFSGF